MPLETPSFINDLVITNPANGDQKSEGDDHIRNIKTVLKACFPGLTGVSNRVVAKAAGFTAVLNDNTAVFNCSTALTVAITAAATLGNGWFIVVGAQGGAVLIDPNGAELINGAATQSIPQGYLGILWCDGAGFSMLCAPQVVVPMAALAGATFSGDVFVPDEAYTDAGWNADLSVPTKNAVRAVVIGVASMPTGSIISFAGTAAPTGYLVCPTTQTNISRTTYAALFAAIGTTWGAGDGSTTFGLPWFPADYAEIQANSNVGTNTVGQLLAHTHFIPLNAGSGSTYSYGLGAGNSATQTSQGQTPAGGSANLPAGVRVLRCIKT